MFSMSDRKSLCFLSPRIFLLLCSIIIHSRGHSGTHTSPCPPVTCGNLDISYPFRLKTADESCRCPRPRTDCVELDCQNSRTVIHADGRSYYVREINYQKHTIRLVDPGIIPGNLSSCPLYSNSVYDFYDSHSRELLRKTVPVAFISGLSRINSEAYVKAPFCGDRNNIFANASEYHSYVNVLYGEIWFWLRDLEDSCTVDRLVLASLPIDSSSLASVYDGLAHGFEVGWYFAQRVRVSKISTRISPAYALLTLVRLLSLRFVIGFLVLMGFVVHTWRKRHLSMDKNVEEFLQAHHNFAPIKYAYSEIKKMTNNFSEKLGQGSYGTVYKGKLRSGPYVAIKMMEQSMASEEEFINEVGTIRRIHHVNVVQLVGFCIERAEYALVYEFLPNGSLDTHIFNQQNVLALTYEKMFEIALGVARGISYLHHGCDMQILHFDIKPHNILLDEKFNPKISDFGLARLHPADESFINLTAARGTMGYMVPEMFYKNIGGISHKADVYSFGMLLMEIASRRKNTNPFAEDTNQIYFPSWVYDQLFAGKDIEIGDTTEEERKMMKKIIIIALWCIQMKPLHRPAMNKIVEMLEGDFEPHLPPKPFVAPHEIAASHGIIKSYSVDNINSLDLAKD